MRILHTADWHLGATLKDVSLLDEQVHFLDWLVELLEEERVDVLLVAGDIFDLHNPSAAAQALYYRFLARFSTLAPAPRAVVVAGNHDSASRLEAPSTLLSALRVHVIGALGERSSWADRLLLPLPDADAPSLVVAAVPYVHEHWLGVSPVSVGPAGLAAAMRDAFASLYASLGEEAESRWPGVPRIAMGHLTVRGDAGVEREDYPNPIHQVGTIDAMPASLFGDAWDYVALGHIHRPMPVGSTTCRYAGTPVPITFREAAVRREVRLLDLHDGTLRQRAVEVPTWRRLEHIRGSSDDVLEALRTLLPGDGLQTLVQVVAEVDAWNPTLEDELRGALRARAGDAPRLVDFRQMQGDDASADAADAEPLVLLEDLSPEDVFLRLVESERPGGADETLRVAFRELAELPEDA